MFKTFSLSFNALYQKVSFEDIEEKGKEKGIYIHLSYELLEDSVHNESFDFLSA